MYMYMYILHKHIYVQCIMYCTGGMNTKFICMHVYVIVMSILFNLQRGRRRYRGPPRHTQQEGNVRVIDCN